MIIEFGEWLPDAPVFGNSLEDIENLVPAPFGYIAIRGNVDVGDMPVGTTTLFGGFSAVNGATVEDFCGDADDLYRLTWGGSSVTTANASKSANAYSAASMWDFTQFGTKIIAVNGGTSGADTPQIITVGSANFADLTTSPPKAKTITTMRDFVVMGHTYDSVDGERNNRIWWCGFGDETDWVPSAATQCDFQDLRSKNGAVQRICGGSDVIIVTTTSVLLMTYVGPPEVVRFDEIAPGRTRGTQYPESVIRDGDTVYYWSEVGPVSVSKTGEVKYLAEGKCQNYLLREVTDSGLATPRAYRDPQYGAICWNIGGTFNLYYFPKFDRFTKIRDSTNVNLGAIWQSRLVQVSSVFHESPLFQKNGTTDLFSRSDRTSTQQVMFETGGLQLFKGNRGLVKGVRILGSSGGNTKSATLSVVALNDPPQIKNNELDPGDFTAFTENTAADSEFQGLSEGRYHFFRGTVIDGASGAGLQFYLKGIEITDASKTGRY
jgi:hypothetical protein